MDETVKDHFRKRLLEIPQRVLNENGQIVEVYGQPERSKREDLCVHDWVCNVVCGCGVPPIYCSKCSTEYEQIRCGALNTAETS